MRPVLQVSRVAVAALVLVAAGCSPGSGSHWGSKTASSAQHKVAPSAAVTPPSTTNAPVSSNQTDSTPGSSDAVESIFDKAVQELLSKREPHSK